MSQIMLGGLLPLALCAWWFWRAGRRASLPLLVLGPLFIGLSGAWAVVPDMPRLLGDVQRYHDWHHASWCNVFWFHCAIDRDEVDWAIYPIAFLAFAALIIWVAWRELRLTENQTESHLPNSQARADASPVAKDQHGPR